MKKIYLFLCFLFIHASGFSQFNETIRTGRPGQSIGAFTVGQGVFQIQSGIDFFGSQTDPFPKSGGALSNTVIRYGITEPFELSALLEYKIDKMTDVGGSHTTSGWSTLDVGMRYHIITGKGALPNVGFQVRWRLPGIGGEYSINQVAPRFLLILSRRFSNKIYAITNWGASWNGNNQYPQGNYTANISYTITDRFGVFLENYGSVYQSNFKTYLDGGFAYLVNNDLQLDLSTGIGNNQGNTEFFVSTGVSWRRKNRKTDRI